MNCRLPKLAVRTFRGSILSILLVSILPRAAAQATDEEGLIKSSQWLVLGPFRQPVGCGESDGDLLQNFLAPSRVACAYPEAGDEVEYDPFVAASTEYIGPETIDLRPLWRFFDDRRDDGVNALPMDQSSRCDVAQDEVCTDIVSWLATYVEYTGAEPVDVELCAGIDDGGQVWMDERVVFNRAGCRTVDACDDLVTVTIEPGIHRFALASFHGESDSPWTARFGLRQGGEAIVDPAPEWIFHGAVRPQYTPPPCPEVVHPVELTLCRANEELGVDLAWENPPSARSEQTISIRVSGEDVRTIAGTETSLTLPPSVFDAVAEFEVCVVNQSGVASCCDVELLTPVEVLGCHRNEAGGLDVSWQNPPNAAVGQAISIRIDGLEALEVPGNATSATVPAEQLPATFSQVCVVNERGVPSCCAVSATDDDGFITTRNWLVLGPFEQRVACNGRELDEVLLDNYIAPAEIACEYPAAGDEIDYDPAAAASGGYLGPPGAEGNPPWRELDDGTPDDGSNQLEQDVEYTAVEDGVMNWLATYVEYRGAEPVDIEICLSVDDAGQVWVDDDLAFNKYECGAADPCEHKVPITVSPGVHRIAAAAFNAEFAWGLKLRLEQLGEPILDDREASPDWVFHGTRRPAGSFPCGRAEETLFLRGDVDGNGALEITDPINNLGFQFLGSYAPTCRDALDFDDNGSIEVTDPIGNLTRQFLGGDPPAPPGIDACGTDPTDDELDCESFTRCE